MSACGKPRVRPDASPSTPCFRWTSSGPTSCCRYRVRGAMRPVTTREILEIEANLFPTARSIVRARPKFPWHRDRAGTITASQLVSSQALAVDFFETVGALTSRDAILDAWTNDLSLSLRGPWKIELEVRVPPELLGEPRPTQIDSLARS